MSRLILSFGSFAKYFSVSLCIYIFDRLFPFPPKCKGVFLQLRNEFEFPAKIIFTNISAGIGVTVTEMQFSFLSFENTS